MGVIEICPSILAADFGRLKDEIEMVEHAGADTIHLDVMDGHFVPNISFGPPVIKSIRKITSLPFWAHLMIEEPGRYLKDFAACGVDGITIHLEVEEEAADLADTIRRLGIKPGISINPDTEIEELEDTFRLFDRILVMTVYPGFGGQSFMPGPLEKIRKISTWQNMPAIEVDGGIDINTASQVVKAGATCLVAGSAIFRDEDPVSALKTLRTVSEKAIREQE